MGKKLINKIDLRRVFDDEGSVFLILGEESVSVDRVTRR